MIAPIPFPTPTTQFEFGLWAVSRVAFIAFVISLIKTKGQKVLLPTIFAVISTLCGVVVTLY